MAHGGFGKRRRVAGRPSFSGGGGSSGGRASGESGAGGTGVRERNRDKGGRLHGAASGGGKKESEKKSKIVSIKNQIRSVERLLKKPLLSEVKDAQEKRLESLKKQAEMHARCELERKMALRYRRVKFFERRKIERRIRRLEKQQRSSMGAGDGGAAAAARATDSSGAADLAQQLAQLAEDLEYVRFFPKTEKYVSLFMGNDDEAVMAKRKDLRVKIKANLAAAVAAGVDLEETGSEDDAMALSEDDFFMAGSSNDDADADDELTDKSPKWGGEERDETSKEAIPPVARIPAASARPPSAWKGGDRIPKGVPPMHSKDRRQQKSGRAFLPPPPRVKSRGGLANRGGTGGGGGGGGVKAWNSAAATASGSGGRRVTKKLRLQAGKGPRGQLPAANHHGGEENPRPPRAWTSSSHSSEVIKGSSTSDVPQQQPPKKRKRTRSKKKK